MTSSNFRALQDTLNRWDSRRRRQELLRYLPIALTAGLLIGLAAALLSRVRPLLTRGESGLFALIFALAALSITALVILTRRRSLAAQARFADRQFALRERMITAVEIYEDRLDAGEYLTSRQLGDTIAAAAAVDTARQMPMKTHPARWLPALAALGLLATALWLPNPQEAILREQRAVTEAVGQQLESLAALSEEISANDALTAAQREALQRPLDQARTALQKPSVSREEAVAALSQAETELRDLSRESQDATLAGALAEAASLSVDEAAEIAQSLQDGQLAEAGVAAGALVDRMSELDAADRQALAERLSAAAADLGDGNAEVSETLNRAAEALAEGDNQAAGEALRETAAVLNEQAKAVAEQASAAADQLGAARGEVAQSGAGQPAGNGDEAASGPGQNGDTAGAGNSGTTGGEDAGAGGPSAGGGHVESVFIPNPAPLDGNGEDVELDVQCLSGSESCGPVGGQTPSELTGQTVDGGSVIPYDRVFGDYRDSAFEALSGGDIPILLQGLIRDYFSALEP